ncbi:MAG TPA: class I SAM-dependent methyltransferase [Vicinamibacterales bacterium]|nr:class I SAM-dependent methyltransferase [Vicinamibacterales bacterium]
MKTQVIGFSVALMLIATPAFAQLGSRPAEDWIARLERPERVAALKTDEVVQKLGLKKGDVVADLGAGAGAFAWPFARAVAPATVYAVEVDKDYIPYLERRAKEQGLSNVKAVLGKFEDPMLPEKVDLAFFHDVLHHIEKRAEYLQAVARYLKPNGRIAVIELDADHPGTSHANEPHLQVSREQVRGWMQAAGLRQLEEIPLYEDKWFVVYGK